MRLTWDANYNMLRLALTEDTRAVGRETRAGTLDVAANGRLVGLELRGPALARLLRRWVADPVAAEFTHLDTDNSAYIDLTIGPVDDEVRSSDVALVAELDTEGSSLAFALPRHGPGYEIAFPSGNR
jgi:hypothetical protein